MDNVLRVYYENAVGQCAEDPQGFARLTYQAGVRPIEAFQTLLGHVTLLLAQRGDGRLLVDQRKMMPFTAAEQQYVIQQWVPRTIVEGGYRHGSVIIARDVFARLATATVMTAVRDLPMTYRYFSSEEEAVAWLLTTPSAKIEA